MGFALIRENRNYRLLLSASSVSNLGDGISSVAMPWLATLLTRDPLMIAAVATAQRLPWFLFALPAGVWTDRSDRRALMLRADIARVGLSLCILAMVLSVAQLPLPETAGPAMILTLAGVAFLLGTAEVIRDNAAQTVLPSIVASGELERANGQMWSAEQVTGQFIGPPLAGLLIGIGMMVPFGVDAVMFAASAGLIWLIALPPRTPSGNPKFWAALKEGWAWMLANREILRLAVMLGIINAMFIGAMTILVLYAQELLKLSAAQYGLLLTCGAAGGVVGGLVSPRIAERLGGRASLLVALSAFAMSHVVIALITAPVAAGFALFLGSSSAMLWNVVTVSYRQRRIPDELLGRVNSVYRFFGWGAMPFGAMGAGALVTWSEPILGRSSALLVPYYLAAGVCGMLIIYAALRLRLAE